MTKAGESILRGASEALEYAREKTAAELFLEVGEHPTLDVVMMRDPREGRTRSDAIALIALLRAERARNIPAEPITTTTEEAEDGA